MFIPFCQKEDDVQEYLVIMLTSGNLVPAGKTLKTEKYFTKKLLLNAMIKQDWDYMVSVQKLEDGILLN